MSFRPDWLACYEALSTKPPTSSTLFQDALNRGEVMVAVAEQLIELPPSLVNSLRSDGSPFSASARSSWPCLHREFTGVTKLPTHDSRDIVLVDGGASVADNADGELYGGEVGGRGAGGCHGRPRAGCCYPGRGCRRIAAGTAVIDYPGTVSSLPDALDDADVIDHSGFLGIEGPGARRGTASTGGRDRDRTASPA